MDLKRGEYERKQSLLITWRQEIKGPWDVFKSCLFPLAPGSRSRMHRYWMKWNARITTAQLLLFKLCVSVEAFKKPFGASLTRGRKKQVRSPFRYYF